MSIRPPHGDHGGFITVYADGVTLPSGEKIDLRSKAGQQKALKALAPTPVQDPARAKRTLAKLMAAMDPPQLLLV